MESYDLPPMSQADLDTLVSLAGPLFGESRTIEKMTGDNTVVGGHMEDGSFKIKNALEQAQQDVRARIPPPSQYVPPEFVQEIQHVQQPFGHVPDIEAPLYIPQQFNPISPGVPLMEKHTQYYPPDNNQLEFSFDIKEQQVTNDLLKEISTKLTKIIKFLDINTPEEVKVKEQSPKKPPHVPQPKSS